MWDNRLTKRNPRAPDYKCQNRSCDGLIWPAKPAESAESAASPDLKDERRSDTADSVLASAREEELPF
jgi:hypothetical protein